MMNANDTLKGYNCTDSYYRYGPSLLITDGVKALCEQFQCFWFMDVIASYQHELKREEFQVWTLKRDKGSAAVVVCTDGNDKVLKRQEIEFTDFAASEATVWVEFDVALLPSEH